MISIIIPVYNEEAIFSDREKYFRELSRHAELIFVDGGSSDRTRAWAADVGRLMRTQKGRAAQMNAGAKAASHNTILFLHADAQLAIDLLEKIEEAVNRHGYIGGCFRQFYDTPGPLFRWIAWTGHMRAKILKIFYGDQGIFVRRDVFEKLGGYPDVPLGEDVLFSKKLKAMGKIRILSDPIHCSSRRWINQGILKTFLLNMRITFGLMIHEDTERLRKCYPDIR